MTDTCDIRNNGIERKKALSRFYNYEVIDLKGIRA